MFTAFADGSCGSEAEVKSDQSFIFNHAGKQLAQMAMECRVLLKPPKTRPGECEAARSHPLQPLKFLDCSGVVARLSVVLAVAFEEGEHSTSEHRAGDSQLGVVHQNDCLMLRNN